MDLQSAAASRQGGGPARVALSDGAGIGIGLAIPLAGSGKSMRAGWRLATCPAALRGFGPCGLRGRRGAARLEARLRPPSAGLATLNGIVAGPLRWKTRSQCRRKRWPPFPTSARSALPG